MGAGLAQAAVVVRLRLAGLTLMISARLRPLLWGQVAVAVVQGLMEGLEVIHSSII